MSPPLSIFNIELEMSKRNLLNYWKGRYKIVILTDNITNYTDPKEA